MAYDKTLAQILVETERRLSQVPGTSVQLYAEDRLIDIIKFVFDQLFTSFEWPQYKFTRQDTLDGSTGVVTSDLSSILKHFTHIKSLYVEDTNQIISLLPDNINPYLITGTTPRYYERVSTASKVFRIWPLASTGDIIIRGKTKPTEFINTTVIDFDHHALVLGTVADYLTDDGTNPESAQKFASLFNARVKEITKQLSGDVQIGNPNIIPTEWT